MSLSNNTTNLNAILTAVNNLPSAAEYDAIIEKDNLEIFENNRVNKVGNALLMYCDALHTAKSSSAVILKTQCFSHDYKLHTIAFPLVKRLNDNVFLDCSSLETVSLPELITMGNSVFQTSRDGYGETNYSGNTITKDNASLLTSISIPKCVYVGKNSFNASYDAVLRLNLANSNISSLRVVNTNAFNKGATTVLNSSTIEAIGNYAFANNLSLVTVILPNWTDNHTGYTPSIGSYPDYNFISYSPETSDIGLGQFRGCTNLKTLSAARLTDFDKSMIIDCTSLETLLLPSVVLDACSLSDYAAGTDRSLKEISYSVTNTNNRYPGRLFTAQDVTWQDQNMYIPSTLETVTINDLTSSSNVFRGCTNIKYANLPDTTDISYTYYGCSNLIKIDYNPNITYTTGSAFFGCTNFTGNQTINNKDVLHLPNAQYLSYTSSGTAQTSGFDRCSSLEYIIAENCVGVGGSSTFNNCTNMKALILGKNPSEVALGATSAFNFSTSPDFKIYFPSTDYREYWGTSQWQAVETSSGSTGYPADNAIRGYNVQTIDGVSKYIYYRRISDLSNYFSFEGTVDLEELATHCLNTFDKLGTTQISIAWATNETNAYDWTVTVTQNNATVGTFTFTSEDEYPDEGLADLGIYIESHIWPSGVSSHTFEIGVIL